MSSKRANSEDEKIKLANSVARYLLGDPAKKIEPLPITQIMNILGFKTRKSVYEYKELAIKLNLLDVDDTGKAILPKITPLGKFKKFTKTNELRNDQIMQDWYLKQTGRKTKKAVVNLNNLTNLFNTLGITPAQFIHDGKLDKGNIVKYREKMLQHFREGTNLKILNRANGKEDSFRLGLNYAINSLCVEHGITWARGDPDMDRKVVGHGLYSHERFTNEQFLIADKYMKKEWGLDSDIFRVFWVGVQSCSRKQALLSMPLEFVVDKPNLIVTKCCEMKTIKPHPEDWDNFIKTKDSIESLRILKKRKSLRIWDTNPTQTIKTRDDNLAKWLKEIYTEVGKTPENNPYFFKKPFHSTRHMGAHYLLSFSNYTAHSFCAMLGHWMSGVELEKSYGSIPPDMIDKELSKYDYDGFSK